MAFKLPTSNVLVLGSNSVHCLLSSTFITRADALLTAHRINDAVELADHRLSGLQGTVTVDTYEADELRYVYQRIGFQCLKETLFDDAGKHFFAGNLDPRVLISYYPDLRGSLFSQDDSVDMFAGVAEHMPAEDSIDDIISINLVRNYSPHLAPNTSTAPATVELRNVLKIAATEMLKVFLRKWRTKRRDREIEKVRLEGRQNGRSVNEVVDTVLAKLYAAGGETTDLLALIESPNDIVVEELESLFEKSNRYDALSRLYKSHGDEAKLLSVWSRLVMGEIIDEDVHDPLESMFTFLTEKRDKSLTQEWGVWLLRWDSERALKLLTSLGGSKRGAKTSTTDEALLLQRIQESDPTAGVQFVEYLVLQRRSQVPDLHIKLAATYVDQLLECLEDDSTSKLWRAKTSSYTSSSSSTSTPFLSYFASTTPDSPSKRTRLKALLFLQASKLYDFEAVSARLAGVSPEWGKILALERTIVLGKLGKHRDALTLLIYSLRDAASAEVYCTLGGEVISQKTSHALAERYSIPIIGSPLSTKLAAPGQRERAHTVDEGLKRELTKVLLEVYMSGGESMAESTARLLNAQAMNLEVFDVISLIPPTWPLRVLSSFLSRSFRRTLHSHHELQLVKALAASENLAIAESSWLALREAGAVIEEEEEEQSDLQDVLAEKVDVQEGEGLGLSISLDEKASLRRPAQIVDVREHDDIDGDDESVESLR